MRRFRMIVPLLLITTILTTGCATHPDAQKKPIRIALSTWPGYAHAYIAQDKGFFKQNGVEVELVFRKEYFEAADLYRQGKVEGVFEVFADALFHNVEGNPTKVVYVTDYSNDGDVIVAGSGINSIMDLKEKPVGIDAINSFSHLFVFSILAKAGLKERDLRFMVVPAQQVPQAIEEGKIAAGHTWEPARSLALKKGYRIIATAGDLPGIITDCLSINAKIAEERPGEVKAIVAALLQARDYFEKNPSESVAIMAKAVGMAEEEMASGLKDIITLDGESNKLVMKRSDDPYDLFDIAEMDYDFYGKRGRYFSKDDIDDIIDPSFL